MTERPCKDCPDRYLGCHDHCKKYLDDRDRRLAQKKEMRRQDNGNEQLRAIYSKKKYKKIRKYGGDLWQ